MATVIQPPVLELWPGERLLWSGHPAQGVRFTARDAYLVPFSLLWGGFAIFWNIGVWSMEDNFFLRIWGLPFLAVGLYVIVGRFVHDAWLRSRTGYAVTDRRIVITRGGTVRSLDLARLPLADMTERADGSGSLVFGDQPTLFGRSGMSLWSPALDSTPQFREIPDVRAVYALITRPGG